MIKAVVFDADKTLWDHYNISEFEEPFTVIEGNSLVDAKGRKLKVFQNVRRTLKELRERGIIIGMATWNFSHKTSLVLKALELEQFFDVVVSRDFPYKFLMLGDFILEMRRRGKTIRPEEILFVDDRRVHFGNVWLYLGKVKCLEMWREVNDHLEILKRIDTDR
ncbi:magnesium-dependent phosphatase-1 [Metallosphaera yellowstonensis MK1]|jgi:magnesium-dependent phosphatase-1|uniref:Magnesium-dependent phosphatase-1 n=1 Tax=Metallosphaera yellowstonensis MK1 TaxID=671065 RepID=H2C9E4_9CREN|nr:magnesium-dependent phosphatase-1 [Metallosphaera yellowstonensis]EHP68770.1 magnesium-dependent phosphatase-1 [Metallosphaera yellowstonensis MK1]